MKRTADILSISALLLALFLIVLFLLGEPGIPLGSLHIKTGYGLIFSIFMILGFPAAEVVRQE